MFYFSVPVLFLKFAKSMGRAKKEFKDGLAEGEEEVKEVEEETKKTKKSKK